MTGQEFITLAVTFVAVASVGATSCKLKHAEESARIARDEAESLRVQLQDAEAENARMHEILTRAYDAVNRSNAALEKAAYEHVERIETINAVDPDWLVCPLPDGVREAFGGSTD